MPYVAGMARAIRQSPKLKKLALCANQLHAACVNALLTADEGLLHAGLCSALSPTPSCGTIVMLLLHGMRTDRLHCVSVCLLQRRPRSGCCSLT